MSRARFSFVAMKTGAIIRRPSGILRHLLCGCQGARQRWLVNPRSFEFVVVEECLTCNATWTMADWPSPIPFQSPTVTH